MEDEFYMRRLDAGLFSLQLIDCIIMEVCSSGVSTVNNSTFHQLLAIVLYLTFQRPRRLRSSLVLQGWITKLHLCPRLNSATKFTKLTIFRERPQSQAFHGFRNKRKRLGTELECRSFEKHCFINYKCTIHHDGRPVPRRSMNSPLPSSKSPHFQNEANCASFLVKMSFICMKMKNHFQIKC